MSACFPVRQLIPEDHLGCAKVEMSSGRVNEHGWEGMKEGEKEGVRRERDRGRIYLSTY